METILNREIIVNKVLCRIMGVLTFVILTGLGAFVRIPLPFTPVPITLQTFFVLLSGAILGGNLGLSAQLSYIILGASGLPIFAGAMGGALYLFGPTAGYLAGFVLSAFFLGKFIKYTRDSRLLTFIIFCLAGLLILGCGVIWLKFILGYSFSGALFIGLIPFLAGDFIKALAAAAIYLKLKPRIKEVF